VLPADQWALQQFGGVRLGDRRLTRRTVKVAAAMAADPSASIPQQNKLRRRIKGAYRLFDHDRLTFESVSQAHWQHTRERADACAVVLLLQDTTAHTFASHPATEGLGRCGKFDQSLGLIEHSVLAVAPQSDGSVARVLGLAWGKLWTREAQAIGRGPKRTAHRLSPDRESTRWLEAVQQIGAPSSPPQNSSKWLHVTDREGDIFDLHEQTTQRSELGLGFLVRIKHLDRSAVAGHDAAADGELTSTRRPKSTLQQVCRAMPELTRTRLWIAPGGGRSGRWAEVAISGGPVTIYSPWYGPNGSRTARPLRCGAVRVWEPNPPPGVQPLEWLLLTSEPVNDASDARRVANYYELRWMIEEYHRCLKSGCKIETRQLESADRLAPFIGIASAVATRLLQLKNDARLAPELPAKQCVEPDHLLALCRLRKLDPKKLTVRQFTHEVAALGGFLGRKRDGEPGWITLWRGWRELDLITLGFQLATTGPPDVGNG
jgi:hypothetical protein